MSDIKIKYTGDLRTKATHLSSGSTIITDAPLDNNGKGEKFSPTDLFATALGSCMLTIMGITAQTHGINIDDAEVTVKKIMGANPRRVSCIKIIINIYSDISEKDRKLLIKAAHHCPVSKSINPDIEEDVTFNFH
tara:strand:+ start:184 stop:588 length:405 start_codon:yes stop_codon:yes gene_type:complete